MHTLKEISEIINGKIIGNESLNINNLKSLDDSKSGSLSFFDNSKSVDSLKKTKASAIIIKNENLHLCNSSAIIVDNPYISFIEIFNFFNSSLKIEYAIHSSSVIDKTSSISKNTNIAANVVIGMNCNIGDNVIIGANCVISDGVIIKNNTEIKPNVTIYKDAIIGSKCIVHSGAVIGSDGFGNIKTKNGNWIKALQLGTVIIDDDVEIGANTTIDRGSLDNTIIESGVRIDNQVHVAHNVIVRKNTAIAGSVVIAGSAEIGANCLIGGSSCISGHLKICDNAILTGASLVTKSINTPGIYGSAIPAKPEKLWKKSLAYINRLDKLNCRVKDIENKITK